MNTGPFKRYPVLIVPGIDEVRFYDKTWEQIREKHPEFALELPSMTSAVPIALLFPSTVHNSNTSNDSVVFVSEETTNYSGDSLRVPVVIKDEGYGVVKSAYFASSSTHGPLIWRRPDDENV